ncbi:hypothetical protein BHU72_13245 [Desulfuribacillus stibiiarsenatis]|uniref:HTH marR-type domain-containing protein n=1 Tax=Desulfuribacillus stibiiarsenatis TaxID=1390249 RepID=A0A1E5L8I3_9FIRM|nr:hypothetical protein BHU72_13245 [Desulfuribacillus stibiiarsenatis]
MSDNKDALIIQIKKLFSDVSTQQALEVNQEKQWLLQNCANSEISAIVPELTVIALHVLDAIGRLQPVNSITIAKETAVPKGTVSKTIKKLISKDLIIKIPLPNNKKETNFYLTPRGKEIFDLHNLLHRKFETAVAMFLMKYDAHELQFLIRFLKDFMEITWHEQKLRHNN